MGRVDEEEAAGFDVLERGLVEHAVARFGEGCVQAQAVRMLDELGQGLTPFFSSGNSGYVESIRSKDKLKYIN